MDECMRSEVDPGFCHVHLPEELLTERSSGVIQDIEVSIDRRGFLLINYALDIGVDIAIDLQVAVLHLLAAN